MAFSAYRNHKDDVGFSVGHWFLGTAVWGFTALDGKLPSGEQRNPGFGSGKGNKQAGQEAGRKPWAGEGIEKVPLRGAMKIPPPRGAGAWERGERLLRPRIPPESDGIVMGQSVPQAHGGCSFAVAIGMIPDCGCWSLGGNGVICPSLGLFRIRSLWKQCEGSELQRERDWKGNEVAKGASV